MQHLSHRKLVILAGVLILSGSVLGSSSLGFASDRSSELEGVWKSACIKSGSSWVQTSATFLGPIYAFGVQSFYASGCSSAEMDYYESRTGTYTIANASSSITGAFEIDFNETSFRTAPMTESAVTRFNRDAVCGFASGWTLTDERDCPTANKYWIYKVESGKLYLGSCEGANDCSSIAKRATALNLSTPLEMQSANSQ